MTVGDLARQLGFPRSEVVRLIPGGHALTFYYVAARAYRIVYNELVVSPGRIRWSLAHEVGHIVLGHLRDFHQSQMGGDLSRRDLFVLEREADTFAAELLAPMSVLKALGARRQDDIGVVCALSRQASANREKDLQMHGLDQIYCAGDQALQGIFEQYLSPVSVCGDPSSLPVTIVARLPEVLWVETKHCFVETDENDRFTTCPRCGNFHFSADARFCRICGLYLYNNCTNEEEGRYSSCGRLNPGDARFCEACGSETYLSKKGLLMTWDELLSLEEGVAAGLVPPEHSKGDSPK
jgi:hypothetical protein